MSCLLELASSHWALRLGAGIQICTGCSGHPPLLVHGMLASTVEVREGLSVPWVSPVLLVVELELDLIFYLIHEDLGQQDSHQLGDGQA